ncbi:hypothetical protein [Actinomadura sp. GTD37]|uniref:hypothetical protein n=1 Tax=Actinomadura sp. GTD37 TaxID=1778030 RepID=UPI0035C0BF55
MTDEPPTPGELRRSIEDIRLDLRERHHALNQRLDTTVPLALWQAHLEASRREHDELAKDIADVNARMDADQRQRSADRRLILMALFTSVLAPLGLVLLQIMMRTKGAAP